MSFLSELRRRNVFKVGAAYAIVAWLLLQISDVVLPTFEAPLWVAQTITFVLAIGFPIAVVLAWAFDVTPQGVEATTAGADEVRTKPTALRFGYVSQGLILVAVGFLVIDQYVLDQRTTLVEPSTTSTAAPGPLMTGTIVSNVQNSAPNFRFTINLGPITAFGGTEVAAHLALSPDGRYLAYAAGQGGRSRLSLRALDELEIQSMPETDGAYHPFFSPDGEWIGFYTEAASPSLRKISVRGGTPQNLTNTNFSTGGSWVLEDTIVFGTGDPTAGRSLYVISANGGTSELLLAADLEKGYVTPHVLPGGDAVLFTIRYGQGGIGNAEDGSIAVLSRETGEIRTLIERGYGPRYAPTGHIVFVRGGDLWAVPFDIELLETTGDEVVVARDVQQGNFQGAAGYTFSDNGILAYLAGDREFRNQNLTSLVWVDLQGREEQLAVEPDFYSNPRISPDGQRLAVSIIEPGNSDIWVYDIARNARNRLTFSLDGEDAPVWTPDGERIVFRSTENGGGIYWRAANGTGQASRLFSNSAVGPYYPESFSPDGTQLLFRQGEDLYVASLEEGASTRPLFSSVQIEQQASISRDGRWIVYSSNEAGSYEIYVQPFPNLDDGKWQISRNGGREPVWAPEGDAIFYRGETGMMAVTIETQPTFSSGTPMPLFRDIYASETSRVPPTYDISPDGQRFLMMKFVVGAQEESADVQLHVVYNWFEELNRLAPRTD